MSEYLLRSYTLIPKLAIQFYRQIVQFLHNNSFSNISNTFIQIIFPLTCSHFPRGYPTKFLHKFPSIQYPSCKFTPLQVN